MRLFDQNISYRLVKRIQDIFPGSKQVRELGLENSSDISIWEYAKSEGLAIVTFDSDFHNYQILKGTPPKIIRFRTGNKSTSEIEELLRERKTFIDEFLKNSVLKDIGCIKIERG